MCHIPLLTRSLGCGDEPPAKKRCGISKRVCARCRSQRHCEKSLPSTACCNCDVVAGFCRVTRLETKNASAIFEQTERSSVIALCAFWSRVSEKPSRSWVVAE